MSTPAISYDSEFDIFYLRLLPAVPSYADEDDDGVVTLRSISDESIMGMVIYRFKERLLTGELENCKLPLSLNCGDPVVADLLSASTRV